MYEAIWRFFGEWMRKDTPYLMWLLSPFTAFRDEDVVDATPTPVVESGDDIEPALRVEVVRLAEEFRGIFGMESIDRLAHESLEIVAATGARSYLAQLAGRFTRERLRALARADGLSNDRQLDVLFVCGRNAARSQMAAALTQSLSHGRISVHSAGTRPSDQVDPAVVAVMFELGVDLAEAFPKPLTDEVIQVADVVITMGCGDACPLLPDKRYEDWPIDDPHGKAVATVREIRDTIRERVEGLVAGLETSRSC